MNNKNVLVVNAGSSSIKAAIYKNEQVLLETQINSVEPENLVDNLLTWIDENTKDLQIEAIGHRIVHGGNTFTEPVQIDNLNRDKLATLESLDPDHLPTALKIIDEIMSKMPDVPQIACFDTAFFHDIPRVAQILPLPRKYESIGFRKYGFHGISYQSILETLSQKYSVDVKSLKIVCAHLGSGVSLAAIKNGEPLDTTMEMTPTSGVPMSTRSGNIDPGIVKYLQVKEAMTIEEFDSMTSKQSGLLGISETSADMYELLENADSDIRCKEAVDVFCYQVKKSIGSLSAVLGGIDALVFSGGMGENAPRIRTRVCDGMQYLGIEVDDEKNQTNTGNISKIGSQTAVYVAHTNEALIIARQVEECLQK